jgi:hypothetical protein
MGPHRKGTGEAAGAKAGPRFAGEKKGQNVLTVTEAPSRFWQGDRAEEEAVMKKIFIVLALAFAFITAMPLATVMAAQVSATAPGPALLTRPGEITTQTILLSQ